MKYMETGGLLLPPKDIQELLPDQEKSLAINLHNFFTNVPIKDKAPRVVVSGGTTPMRFSEIPFILYSTDFDKLIMIDPGYEQRDSLAIDLKVIRELDPKKCVYNEDTNTATFNFEGKLRTIEFIVDDLTDQKNYPKSFDIYISGRRVVVGMSENLKEPYGKNIRKMIDMFPDGVYIVPDREFDDERFFGNESPSSLGLKEIEGIRETFETSTVPEESLLEYDQHHSELIKEILEKKLTDQTWDPEVQIVDYDENFQPVIRFQGSLSNYCKTNNLDLKKVIAHETGIVADNIFLEYSDKELEKLTQIFEAVDTQARKKYEMVEKVKTVGLYKKSLTTPKVQLNP